MPDTSRYTWLFYALASAVSAGAVSVLGKLGTKSMNSDAATALRSVVQAAFVVTFAWYVGVLKNVTTHLGWKTNAAITAAGVCGGLSWIFMFRALKLADNAKVMPVDKLSVPISIFLGVLVLGEKVAGLNWVGVALIAVGAYLAAHKWA